MNGLRYTAVFVGVAVVAVALATVLSSILSWVVALVAGGVAAWVVSTRGGGWPLLAGLVAVFGLAYGTTLEPSLAQNETMALVRLLSYAYVFGGIVGGAVGSMKREVDRQRSRKAS